MLPKKKNRGMRKLEREKNVQWQRGLCQAGPQPISQRLEQDLDEPPTTPGSTRNQHMTAVQ
jgi:hypothetical protein